MKMILFLQDLFIHSIMPTLQSKGEDQELRFHKAILGGAGGYCPLSCDLFAGNE